MNVSQPFEVAPFPQNIGVLKTTEIRSPSSVSHVAFLHAKQENMDVQRSKRWKAHRPRWLEVFGRFSIGRFPLVEGLGIDLQMSNTPARLFMYIYIMYKRNLYVLLGRNKPPKEGVFFPIKTGGPISVPGIYRRRDDEYLSVSIIV